MEADPTYIDQGRVLDERLAGETEKTQPAVEFRVIHPVSITSDAIQTGKVALTDPEVQMIVPHHPDRLRVTLMLEPGGNGGGTNFAHIDGQRGVTALSAALNGSVPIPLVLETTSAIYAIGQGVLSWVSETRTTPRIIGEPKDGRSSPFGKRSEQPSDD